MMPSYKPLVLILLLAIILGIPHRAMAQSDFPSGGGSRFQPPIPPDFSDDDDEWEDDGFGPTFPSKGIPPGMGPPGAAGNLPPGTPIPGGGGVMPPGGGFPQDNRSTSPFPANKTVAPGKFRFKLVEGVFWEKGKKRGRGNRTHVSGNADSGSRG